MWWSVVLVAVGGLVFVSGLPSAATSPVVESGWKMYTTFDNLPYFYNEKTEESVWTLPESDQQQGLAVQSLSQVTATLPAVPKGQTSLLAASATALAAANVDISVSPSFQVASTRPSPDQITLVLQGDVKRIRRVGALADQWKGPITAAILATADRKAEVQSALSSLGDNARSFADVHLCTVSGPWKHYPINKMRNIAMKTVQTKWMFIMDIDEDVVFSMSSYQAKLLPASLEFPGSQVVFALMSFQWGTDTKYDAPHSKAEVMNYFQSGKVAVKAPHYPVAYTAPSFSIREWGTFTNARRTKFGDSYEPYYIAQTGQVPDFDPQFVGWGGNYAIQTFEMAVDLHFQFVVLPDVFTFVGDVPSDNHNHPPPADPGLASRAWGRIGSAHGCAHCEPYDCVGHCPWMVDGGSKAVAIQSSAKTGALPATPDFAKKIKEKGSNGQTTS